MVLHITLKKTGIREIDEQHQQLVRYLERLNSYRGTLHGQVATFEALDALNNYTLCHFAYEESLLRALRFPGAEAHKTKHQALLREVRSIYQEIDKDRVVTPQLMEILADWIVQHINEDDQDFAAFFAARRDGGSAARAVG